MAILLHGILIAVIVLLALFVLTFTVYFFNLDMKLMALMAPLFEKHYDKVKRDKHL